MKRRILLALFTTVLAFVFSISFVGCKKEKTETTPEDTTMEESHEEAAPEATDEG